MHCRTDFRHEGDNNKVIFAGWYSRSFSAETRVEKDGYFFDDTC